MRAQDVEQDFWHRPVDDVLHMLDTSPDGLSSAERRLRTILPLPTTGVR